MYSIVQKSIPNVVILVEEILPHPTDQQANGGISTINYLKNETYASLNGDIRYVQHPVCRPDNELYDSDGMHLNKLFRNTSNPQGPLQSQTRQETIFYKKGKEPK